MFGHWLRNLAVRSSCRVMLGSQDNSRLCSSVSLSNRIGWIFCCIQLLIRRKKSYTVGMSTDHRPALPWLWMCHVIPLLAWQSWQSRFTKNGGCLLTITFCRSEKVVEDYNLMGPVTAASVSLVGYMAAELGPKVSGFMLYRSDR